MHAEDIETLFDSIAEGRKTLRVFRGKRAIANGHTFVVTFLLNADTRIYNELCAEAERRDQKVKKLVRGYVASCFKNCLADAEHDTELPKAA
jgi:hypothetical protein